MRISLVGAYDKKDGYLGAARALEKQNHIISFIPAHQYKSENPKNHTNLTIKYLKEQEPEIINFTFVLRSYFFLTHDSHPSFR